jgi:hypothetical protein
MDFIRSTEFLGQYGCIVEECCLLRCDAMHCEVLAGGGLQFATNTSEELAFSICRAKAGGSRFLLNVSTCIRDYTASYPRRECSPFASK